MSEEREPAFNPDAGEHVESAACRLLAMARERNAEVFCLFNDTRMTARPGMLLEEVLDGWSEGRRRTNETTPDAVERAKLLRSALCAAASDADEIRATILAERARHAEEVARLRDVHLDETRALDDLRLKEIASLRDQLRRVEGEREEVLRMIDGLRKSEKTAREYINMRLRDEAQAENVQLKAELTPLRSLLPDVRALARWAIETEHMSDHVNTDQIGDVGRRILAALDSQGGEGE